MRTTKYQSPRNTGISSKRKFKGFDYYLMGTDKLSKNNRESFLTQSNIILQTVVNSLHHDTETLMSMNIYSVMDSNLSDLELLDQWNHMYDTYGYLMDKFKEKWEKKQLKGQNSFKLPKKFEGESELEELKQRVSQLEMEMKLLSFRVNKRVSF